MRPDMAHFGAFVPVKSPTTSPIASILDTSYRFYRSERRHADLSSRRPLYSPPQWRFRDTRSGRRVPTAHPKRTASGIFDTVRGDTRHRLVGKQNRYSFHVQTSHASTCREHVNISRPDMPSHIVTGVSVPLDVHAGCRVYGTLPTRPSCGKGNRCNAIRETETTR